MPFQESPLNEEPLRPSSHVEHLRAETTGTPRAWAAAMIASEPDEVALSVCMLAVKTP